MLAHASEAVNSKAVVGLCVCYRNASSNVVGERRENCELNIRHRFLSGNQNCATREWLSFIGSTYHLFRIDFIFDSNSHSYPIC